MWDALSFPLHSTLWCLYFWWQSAAAAADASSTVNGDGQIRRDRRRRMPSLAAGKRPSAPPWNSTDCNCWWGLGHHMCASFSSPHFTDVKPVERENGLMMPRLRISAGCGRIWGILECCLCLLALLRQFMTLLRPFLLFRFSWRKIIKKKLRHIRLRMATIS